MGLLGAAHLTVRSRVLMLEGQQIIAAAARPAAVIPIRIPRPDMPKVMGPAIGELLAAIAAEGKHPAGPLFTHHLTLDKEIFDFEVGFPVHAPIGGSGRVRPGQLPGGRIARAIYQGPYDGLLHAWGEFERWIAAQGHRRGATLWESYLLGPEASADPKAWRTELNRPLVD